jgi:hypothetical protein
MTHKKNSSFFVSMSRRILLVIKVVQMVYEIIYNLKSYFVVIKKCQSPGIPAARGATVITWSCLLLVTGADFRVRLRGYFFMRQSLTCDSRLSRRYVSSFGIQGVDLFSHDEVHCYEEESKLSFFIKIWKFCCSWRGMSKVPISLYIQDKNKGRFAWTPIHIFDHVSLNSS